MRDKGKSYNISLTPSLHENNLRDAHPLSNPTFGGYSPEPSWSLLHLKVRRTYNLEDTEDLIGAETLSTGFRALILVQLKLRQEQIVLAVVL
jgi:hypothetical protein